MRTLADVIAFLERTAQETFDAGVFEYDMGREHSATEQDAAPFAHAAEVLQDIRTLICGGEGD